MNIFVLDSDPQIAAQSLCDKHCVRMPLESAQMLSTVFSLNEIEAPYRPTHASHPCTLWTMESEQNFLWHALHAIELCREYTFRYGKRHASQDVIEWCVDNADQLPFPSGGLTEFRQAMPKELRGDDPVEAYRRYYILEKSRFARWSRGRQAPVWWKNEQSLPHHPSLTVSAR